MSVGESESAVSETVIRTRSLTKVYKDTRALSEVSLEVRSGEIMGLLGPNGSGKTTTIRILLGFLRPTDGRAEVHGFDCWTESRSVRELTAFLPGEIRLYGHLSGLETLKLLSRLRGGPGLDRAVWIAERVMGLDLRRRVRALSTGMKQKLALAQVFSEPVRLLILDEPTSALDPSARAIVLRLVELAREAGQTVVFSGHVLSEVEKVCDRVAIMKRGRLMHVEDLRNRGEGVHRLVLVRFFGEPPRDWPEPLELTIRRRVDDRTILFEHRGEALPMIRWLALQEVEDLAVGTDDLQSLYDRFHGPGADDDGPVENGGEVDVGTWPERSHSRDDDSVSGRDSGSSSV